MGDVNRRNFETVNDRAASKILAASATLAPYERNIITSSAGAVTVTLPPVTQCSGAIFTVYNAGTGVTTVSVNGSDSTIRKDGGAAATTTVLNDNGHTTLLSNGADWFELGQYDGT
jgi:hypothetical protein